MGKIIVIDCEENRILFGRLRESGVDLLLLEMPDIASATDPLESLEGANAVVFLDQLTADAFLTRLEESPADVLMDRTVCAAGTSVVETLREHSVHSDVTAYGHNWDEISDELRSFTGNKETRALVVGGDSMFRESAGNLSGGGARVHRFWPLGESAWKPMPGVARVRALALGGAVDAIVVGRREDLVAIETIFGTVGELGKLSEFQTDDDAVRRFLAERGVLTRPIRK